jgi:hydroxypyruvate reductase
VLGSSTTQALIAARASAFGMQVAYCGRRRQADVTCADYPSVESLAQVADFWVLAVPGGEETRYLVDAKVLATLGCKATIAGAGLDVFALERKVPEALLRLETVVLTPHLASATHETRAAMADLVWKNLKGFFCSGTLLTAV